MKEQLVSILQDIKDGENIENYLLILAALIIAVLSLAGITNDAIITSVILAVLSLIIYGQIKSDRLLRSIKQTSEIKGVSAFYPDRQDMPSLESRVLSSHEEIAVMGIQLSAIAHSYLPLLKQQAIKGCRIKLLMMSPVDNVGNHLPWVDEFGRVHSFIGLRSILSNNVIHYANWLDELPDNIRKRVEIRAYPTLPTDSVLLIDKDRETGTIKIESSLHRFSPSECPSFVVDRSSSPALYRRLVTSFNDLWSEGLNVSDLRKIIEKAS